MTLCYYRLSSRVPKGAYFIDQAVRENKQLVGVQSSAQDGIEPSPEDM